MYWAYSIRSNQWGERIQRFGKYHQKRAWEDKISNRQRYSWKDRFTNGKF